LPGGYIEIGETWQMAGAREAFEEAGVVVDPAQVNVVGVYSGSESTLIIVGQAAPLRTADLPAFTPTPEASERVLVREPVELAFPLHTQALAQYLRR
jgi:ADP-ribose pyrophosphatase YjhB (NUDIX family)